MNRNEKRKGKRKRGKRKGTPKGKEKEVNRKQKEVPGIPEKMKRDGRETKRSQKESIRRRKIRKDVKRKQKVRI